MWDLVVVGHGVSGLAAAVAFLEERPSAAIRVAVIDRAPTNAHGRPPQLEPSLSRTARDHAPLDEDAPPSSAMVDATDRRAALFERARVLGVHFFVGVELVGIELSPRGEIAGVCLRRDDDDDAIVSTTAVVLAPGPLDRDLDELAATVHAGAMGRLSPSAPHLCVGAAVSAAAAVGAAPAGSVGSERVLPIDPRSDRMMPIVATWFCGVLLGLDGRRFIDEAELAHDLQAEKVARAVLAQGGLAFAVTDASGRAAMPFSAALRSTDQPVITADSIAELAERLGMEASVLVNTVSEYNAAVPRAPSGEQPRAIDGTAGLSPPKSAWAWPLTEPPFEALPVGAQIVSTRERLRVDGAGHVMSTEGRIIPGLFAAGDVAGSSASNSSSAESPPLDAVASGRLAGAAAAAVSLR
jgi:tricarballylate dehydrogenase